MDRVSPLPRVYEITKDQWGLVTRRQLTKAGIGSTSVERLTGPGGVLERVAHGVYQAAAAPEPDHRDLRAAWLQLAPETLAWERMTYQGVVSHRSAASIYGLGHLPADRHEFTVRRRKQIRRGDVLIHVRHLADDAVKDKHGLLVTRPARIAADLVRSWEDPEAVAQVIADAIRGGHENPGAFADFLAPCSAALGLGRDDGVAAMRWLLEMTEGEDRGRWIEDAAKHVSRAVARAEPGEEPGDRGGTVLNGSILSTGLDGAFEGGL